MTIFKTTFVLLILSITFQTLIADSAALTDKKNVTDIELIVNAGHGSETAQIEICMDGMYAVSRAEDADAGQIKLWDLSTARLLRNFNGYDFALSPDKTFLYINETLTNNSDNSVRQPTTKWDLTTLTQVDEQWSYRITRISSDGKRALSSDFSDDGQLPNAFIFELATGKKLATLPGQLLAINDELTTAILAQAERRVIYRLKDQRSWLLTGDDFWLADNGELVLALERTGNARLWRHNRSGLVTLAGDYKDCLAINAEVAVLVARTGEIVLYQIAQKRYQVLAKDRLDQYAIKAVISNDDHKLMLLWSTLELAGYRLSDGRRESLIALPQAQVGDLAYSDVAIDLTHSLITAGGLESFHCWRIEAGQVNHIGSRLARSWSPGSCRINSTGDLMLCQQFYDEETSQLVVWDLKQGDRLSESPLSTLGDNTPMLENIQLAGRWALVKSYLGFELYDLRGDKRVLQLSGNIARLSADGQRLFNIISNNQIDIYRLNNLSKISTIKTSSRVINFTIDHFGNYISVLDENNAITNYQSDNARVVSVIGDSKLARIKSLQLSNSGRMLISAHSDNSLSIWHSASGQLAGQLRNGEENVNAIYISEDEQRAFTIDKRGGNCRLWDLKQSQLLRAIPGVSQDRITDLVISNSLSYAAINGVIWDLNQGQALTELGQGYATISTDGINAVVADREGYQLWQLNERELLATMSSFEHEWLIYTPDHHFDSSHQAQELLSWYAPTERGFNETRDYMREFYRPGLLTRLYQRGRR